MEVRTITVTVDTGWANWLLQGWGLTESGEVFVIEDISEPFEYEEEEE